MKMLRTILGCMAIGGTMLLTAGPAHAGTGSVYIDLPGFSIGYSDHYYDRSYHRKKHRHKRHRKYRDRYDRYYDEPRYSDRYYDRRYYQYDDRYYNRYYDDYDYRPKRRSYRRSGPICPQRGFSRYRLRGHSCYRHKDHYHCD